MPHSEWGNDKLKWKSFQEGDSKAFKEIYFQYYNPLFAFCVSILKSEKAAEDCLHDFFLHIWKKREHTHLQASIQALLYKSLKNFCLDYLRKQGKLSQHTLKYASSQSQISLPIETQLIEGEQTEEKQILVRKLIQLLSPLQKEALHLRYYHQLSIEEIAQVMNLSYSAVAQHLSRAIKTLQQKRQYIKKMYMFLITILLGC